MDDDWQQALSAALSTACPECGGPLDFSVTFECIREYQEPSVCHEPACVVRDHVVFFSSICKRHRMLRNRRLLVRETQVDTRSSFIVMCIHGAGGYG